MQFIPKIHWIPTALGTFLPFHRLLNFNLFQCTFAPVLCAAPHAEAFAQPGIGEFAFDHLCARGNDQSDQTLCGRDLIV